MRRARGRTGVAVSVECDKKVGAGAKDIVVLVLKSVEDGERWFDVGPNGGRRCFLVSTGGDPWGFIS